MPHNPILRGSSAAIRFTPSSCGLDRDPTPEQSHAWRAQTRADHAPAPSGRDRGIRIAHEWNTNGFTHQRGLIAWTVRNTATPGAVPFPHRHPSPSSQWETRRPAPAWQNRCGSKARSPGMVGGSARPSAQGSKYECRPLVPLGKDRDSGLLQDLRASKLVHARRNISIRYPAVRRSSVPSLHDR